MCSSFRDDVNFNNLRHSSQKSHRLLLNAAKEYNKCLRSPMRPLFEGFQFGGSATMDRVSAGPQVLPLSWGRLPSHFSSLTQSLCLPEEDFDCRF